ncbi:MAG: potassium channel family protein [Chthoniobacterales bacterium]
MAQAVRMRPRWRRFSAIELLVALAVLLGSAPFIAHLAAGVLLESILLTIVLLSAVLAISVRRSVALIAAGLALPTLAGRWIHQFRPEMLPAEVFLVGGSLLVLFVIVNLLRFVLSARVVNAEVLCAAVSAYLLLGLLWTFAYWLVAELIPNAFLFNLAPDAGATMQGFNSLYFSLITLSTVGYGDITPVADVARMLAALESITGLLYVAILIARLVALQAVPKSPES